MYIIHGIIIQESVHIFFFLFFSFRFQLFQKFKNFKIHFHAPELKTAFQQNLLFYQHLTWCNIIYLQVYCSELILK